MSKRYLFSLLAVGVLSSGAFAYAANTGSGTITTSESGISSQTASGAVVSGLTKGGTTTINAVAAPTPTPRITQNSTMNLNIPIPFTTYMSDSGQYTTWDRTIEQTDLNGDGQIDYFLHNNLQGVATIYYNNGNGTWRVEDYQGAGITPSKFFAPCQNLDEKYVPCLIQDINGDGLVDFFAIKLGVYGKSFCIGVSCSYAPISALWINKGNGTWVEDQNFKFDPTTANLSFNSLQAYVNLPKESIKVSDVNGDGLPDISIAKLTTYLGAPNQEYKAIWVNTGTKFQLAYEYAVP